MSNRIQRTVEEFKFGLMGVSMKVIGKIIKLMVKADLFMVMETFTKGIGLTIKLKDLEFTHI